MEAKKQQSPSLADLALLETNWENSNESKSELSQILRDIAHTDENH